MKKEFIPYEQALELKKLGFDEPCFYPFTNFSDLEWSKVDSCYADFKIGMIKDMELFQHHYINKHLDFLERSMD
jgi:hypothetical protein